MKALILFSLPLLIAMNFDSTDNASMSKFERINLNESRLQYMKKEVEEVKGEVQGLKKEDQSEKIKARLDQMEKKIEQIQKDQQQLQGEFETFLKSYGEWQKFVERQL